MGVSWCQERVPSAELPGAGGMQAEAGYQGDMCKGGDLCLPPRYKSESPAASPLGLLEGNCRLQCPSGWHWSSSKRRGHSLRPSACVQGQTVFLQHQRRGSRRPRPAPHGQSTPPRDDLSAWSQSQQNRIVSTEMLGLSICEAGRSTHFPVAPLSHKMDCAHKRVT